MTSSGEGIEGRVALVTGGSRGIGRACCRRLAAAGVHVAVNYQSNRDAAAECVAELRERGVRAVAVQADVSLPEQVDAMIGRVRQELGPVELLVNNAGVFLHGGHETVSRDVWQRTLDVNLTGTYLVTWAVKSGMIERGYGRIVNISSIAGLRARPQAIPYAVSKAGVIALTRSLAEALAPRGIRVNAVAPGLISTEILEGVDPARLQAIIEATPIQRYGRPEEIAEMTVFLLSDRSSYTTGQTLVASGGRVTLP